MKPISAKSVETLYMYIYYSVTYVIIILYL